MAVFPVDCSALQSVPSGVASAGTGGSFSSSILVLISRTGCQCVWPSGWPWNHCRLSSGFGCQILSWVWCKFSSRWWEPRGTAAGSHSAVRSTSHQQLCECFLASPSAFHVAGFLFIIPTGGLWYFIGFHLHFPHESGRTSPYVPVCHSHILAGAMFLWDFCLVWSCFPPQFGASMIYSSYWPLLDP